MSELPDLPDFNLARLMVKQRKVVAEGHRWLGTVLTPIYLSGFSGKSISALELGRTQSYTIIENMHRTFDQLVGCKLDEKILNTFAWQLVGRFHELEAGPIVLYDGVNQRQPEWVPLEIMDLKEVPWEDKIGYQFILKAYAGHPAGFTLAHKFPATWLNFFAYQVGFNRATSYDGNVKHFMGLRFWAWRNMEGTFEEWRMSAEFKKSNAEIIKLRTRNEYERAECPKGHPLDRSCFDCREKCHANTMSRLMTAASATS